LFIITLKIFLLKALMISPPENWNDDLEELAQIENRADESDQDLDDKQTRLHNAYSVTVIHMPFDSVNDVELQDRSAPDPRASKNH
jgi:hypothetical protein